jgi:hypothetical protein
VTDRLPTTPPGIEAAGRSLWRKLCREYEFTAAQLELLRQLCQVEDRLTQVVTRLDGVDLVVEGKAGMRSHPLLATERDLRATSLRLFRALAIEQDLVEDVRPRYDSERRRLAAVNGHAGRRKVL